MSRDPIDIKAKAPFPAGVLSNFTPHSFTLDDVACASMEEFLQSLKVGNIAQQARVCALVGTEAQSRGRREDWSSGTLWWRGSPLDRLSDEYQVLLDRAYEALLDQAPRFRHALSATGDAPLTHRMGKSDPCETILTEEEFCTRLERLRTRIGESARST
jgi:predicted NAD-dependent protein-ADP-ribosyltransferase YbiA (DUF1768 family)